MASSSPKPRVYRLRGCPAHLDRLGATELLSLALGDVTPPNIRIQSLAPTLDQWARPPTKVGTLMFLKHPALIETEKGISEWNIPVPGFEKPLVLDTHFLGMTPLNDVERETHKFDCIAISGLASHPFGSWQPKREDRSFMWIRDELPRSMPDTRFSIYGYDTTLVRSNSFQSIEDLAASLIDHIKASVLTLSTAKPLLFLAHSLGGIILKEAFVALANGHERSMHILSLFQGGVFFGVPSQGMATSHLLAMVKGQVNEQLVRDLSMGSEYLRSLDDRFSGLALVRGMCLYWAYETKTSPTVIKNSDGFFTRAGPEEILVPKESATRSLNSSRTSAIFPINNNHSDMVKFSAEDPNFRVVVDKLRVSCSGGRHRSDGYIGTLGSHVTMGQTVPSDGDGPHGYSTLQGREWKINGNSSLALCTNFLPYADRRVDLMESLEFPDQNGRFETIEKSFEHTCEWVFDVEHGSLSRWLKDGESFFWIHGKPGSGKSTLMKFIAQHGRTWELLHKISSEAVQIRASFLFHDRGTSLQKSFEGLLRSLLFQIIDKLGPYKATVVVLLKPLLDKHWSSKERRFRNSIIDDLESCIAALLQQNYVKLDMFFLLDALDEYDGQPDFVCGFIKELMKMTNSPNKLKILFSSRPWETFQGQFAAVPSIRVQDFTKGDIETYCWGIVDSKGEEISTKLDHIVPIVINRADGVFLWVKLVLLELTNEALRGNDSDGLANILSSIPSDLHEYYSRTVQRIPERLRWDAYVILEVLSTDAESRGVWEHGFEMMMALLECSRHSTFEECRKGLQSATLSGANKSRDKRLTRKDCAPVEYTGGAGINLSIATGNLAEVVYTRDDYHRIQFAHQTVREFVRGQYFKRFVLGHKARRTQENGYTFIAKYFLVDKQLRDAIPYLKLHERTTGCNLKDFLDSMPKKYFSQFIDERSSYRPDGLIAFSVYSHQRLYLEGTLRRDPDALRKTQERLLLASRPPRNYLRFESEPNQEHQALLRFVLEHGYTVEQDRQAFRRLMQEQIRFLRGRINPHSSSKYDLYIRFLEINATVLIEHGQDPNIWITTSKGSWICSRRFARKRKAIHLAKTRELARCLLEYGAQINGLDSAGNTPLDCLLRHWSLMPQPDKSYWSSFIHQTGILLIEYGGNTKTTTRKTWEWCLSDFQANGLDIMPFRESLDRIRFEKNIRERARDLVDMLHGRVG
ncbi:hypothetical protein K449DRAFT_426090 [Hypoxylon sp. EC38]|nr:hypothetical protein K449DRAFT_426090 [Hypoxylon sp. EC38]